MELEAGEPLVDRFAGDGEQVGVTRVHRPDRDAGGQLPRRLGDPRVDGARDAGLVRVAEEAEALDAVRRQRVGHLPGVPPVAGPPAVAREDLGDRARQPLRMEVNMHVD